MGLCLAAPAALAAFDFAALQALLQERNIGSVEELLAALPASQRNHYALMFESRSLQAASGQQPRAILFGPDARFILTFNGSAAQRGFRAVETMEFDEASKEFRLRELEFPERPAGAGGVLISAINPERCRRCHGAPVRPVWDTFPLWPGAYGEHYRASLSPQERRGLAEFLAQQQQHPRYRYLLDTRRLADPETFRPSAAGQYSATTPEPPNADLTLALSRLQAQAITRELQRRPAFATYQYALLGLADDSCGPLADFLPDAQWRAQRDAFARFVADTTAANTRQAQLKAVRAARAGGAARYAAAATASLTAVRFVSEAALGVPTADWTLALEKGSYDFTMPPLTVQPLRESLLAQLVASDATIAELSYTPASTDGDRYCSYLKKRSRSALAAAASAAGEVQAPQAPTPAAAAGSGGSAAAPPVTAAALSAPETLRLCVNCHETGVAPSVPFSDPTQLARQLRTRPAAHGVLMDEIRFRLSAAAGAQRMPLGLNLTEAERDGLEAYFLALAASTN